MKKVILAGAVVFGLAYCRAEKKQELRPEPIQQYIIVNEKVIDSLKIN